MKAGLHRFPILFAALPALVCCCAPVTCAEWATSRGSAERTGNVDDQAGPATPVVKWAYKAQQDFVASPVPEGSAIYISALGPFNTGMFHCLATPGETVRPLWSKSPPYLTRPTVSAPAISEGLVFFGDGMHQTDDAVLYCVTADTGRPVWQFPVPGKLVHLEGAPTVDRGRLYIGDGAAGVLCLETKRVVLAGQEMDVAASQAMIEEKWKELTSRKDAGKDLTYAPPPSDDALPKPAPKLVWQKGKDAWHVDAPVALAGDLVLVGSAYLDEEKNGKRALIALRVSDGGTVWETPLELNPWAGATVSGRIVLAACSSIRFDPDQIRTAQGEVVAMDLEKGQILWRRKVPGGILSPIAAKRGLAVFTATDGKVRAWDVASGKEQWSYDGKCPFFAGPAVAGGIVYAADLKSVVYALALSNGRVAWTFDAAQAPGMQLPGMVYGSPVVHRGRIYLATCNVAGENTGKPCAILCLADRKAVQENASAVAIAVDRQRRTVSIPCHIAPRKLPTLTDVYPIEVMACFPSPLGQKAHETVVTIEAKPSEVQRALEQLGLKPGEPIQGDAQGAPTGEEVDLFLEIRNAVGAVQRVPLEETLTDMRTALPMPHLTWRFTGSASREVEPGSSKKTYGADIGGTLITLFPVTDETVIQADLSLKRRRDLRLDTNRSVLPPEGTEAVLVIAAVAPRPLPVLADELGARSGFVPIPLPATKLAPPAFSSFVAVVPGWQLPPAPIRVQPRLSRAELPALQSSPVEDPPQSPQPLPLPSPASQRLPTMPLVCMPAADTGRLPDLPRSEQEDPVLPGSLMGAGADVPRPPLPGTAPELRKVPAAFLRLPIPDPYETPMAVRLNPMPPDNMPPVFSPVFPARPALQPAK